MIEPEFVVEVPTADLGVIEVPVADLGVIDVAMIEVVLDAC